VAATEAAMVLSLAEVKTAIKNHVATSSTFEKQTGSPRLASAVRSKRTKNRITVWVQGVVPRSLEYGAKMHFIPKRAKRGRRRLRFVSGGDVVFARQVLHPGNPPYRFLGQAVDATRPLFEENLTRRLREAASAF